MKLECISINMHYIKDGVEKKCNLNGKRYNKLLRKIGEAIKLWY